MEKTAFIVRVVIYFVQLHSLKKEDENYLNFFNSYYDKYKELNYKVNESYIFD